MAIGDTGFGLNYNQGFGSRSGGTVQLFDPQATRDYANAGLKRQQSALDFGYNQQLQGQGIAGQRNLLDATNAQRQREAQLQAGTAQSGFATSERNTQTQAEAAKLPAELQQQRFGQVFPYLRDALDGTGSGSDKYTGAGQVGTQPRIDATPVWNDAQIQQQVNTMRAGNDASTAGKVRGMQAANAGRGLGANSPLSQALGAMYQGQGLQANTAGETSTRLNSAQANATQLLAGQKAQEGQFASRQAEDIQRNQVRLQSRNALLGALSGLV